MSKSTRSRSILATLVLGAGLLFFVQPVQAAATLSCLPPSGNADRFTITPGEAVAFACTVRSEEASSAFLLGTLTSGDGSTSAAGSDAALEGGTPLDVTLSFPALFQPGSYRFAFTLFDKATKKPLSEEVVLTGTVGGRHVIVR